MGNDRVLEGRLITSPEACGIITAKLPVSLRTVQRWLKSGTVEAVKMGNRFFTTREAVEKYLRTLSSEKEACV
jgi:excisionase family DNA binding protein